jgi:hypothetical protein
MIKTEKQPESKERKDCATDIFDGGMNHMGAPALTTLDEVGPACGERLDLAPRGERVACQNRP